MISSSGIGYITMTSAERELMSTRKGMILQNRIRRSLQVQKLPAWSRRDMRTAMDRLDYVAVGISGGDLNSWVKVTAYEFYGRCRCDSTL